MSGSTTRVYDYDNYGQLARRTTNGTVDRYYLWDGGQLMAILDGSANARVAEFIYNPGTVDAPLARIAGPKGSSSVHFYARDAIGNVIAQFSGSTVEQSLTYDPWGAARVQQTTGDTTQLRWKGLLYEDGVTSLYYMRARWYDPVTRRFISPDPLNLSSGKNQFSFAGGDPVNGSDASGMECADPESGDDCGGGGGGGDGSDDGGGASTSDGGGDDSGTATDDGGQQGPDDSQDASQDNSQDNTNDACHGFSPDQCAAIQTAIQELQDTNDPTCQALGNDAAQRWNNSYIVYGGAVAVSGPTTAADTPVGGLYLEGVFFRDPTVTPKTLVYNYGFTGSTDPNAAIDPQQIYTTVAHEETHATPPYYYAHGMTEPPADDPSNLSERQAQKCASIYSSTGATF